MKINSRGLELVKHFEGLQLSAYKCPAGVWTIGWGHTGLRHRDGSVFPGRKITRQQADELLLHDLSNFEARVTRLVAVPLTGDQFSALVSFDFNTGALHRSTLLRKLNNRDYPGASGQFLLWVRGGGRVLPGLVRRRRSEKNLFDGKLDFLERA